MLCLYCGTPLAIMRMLANGTFCCDEHRTLYETSAGAKQISIESAEVTAASQASPSIPPEPPADNSLRNLSVAVAQEIVVSAAPEPPSTTAQDEDLEPPPPDRSLIDLPPPAVRPSNYRIVPVDPGGAIKPAFALIAPTSKFTVARTWPPALFHIPRQLRGPNPRTHQRALKTTITALDFNTAPLLPKLNVEPLRPDQITIKPPANAAEPIDLLRETNPIDFSSQRLREIWKNAPGDLKLIAMVIPLILLLTLNAAGPRLYARPVSLKAGTQPIFDGLLMRNWIALRKTIAHRAAYDYIDDFRSGLDAWTIGSGSNWSYDRIGFVRPGNLALFRPTIPLADYEVQFIARIDEKGLGFAFRAADNRNYEAARFVVNNSGPVPEVRLVRYSVKDGREGPKTEKTLAVQISCDTFFDVHLEVKGNDFTLMVMDRVADSWSDDRLKIGGIGFFCGKGEQARVRRVEVSYQNDSLGRLCAYFSGNDNDGS